MIGYIFDRDLIEDPFGDIQGPSTIVYGPLKVTNVNILNKSREPFLGP